MSSGVRSPKSTSGAYAVYRTLRQTPALPAFTGPAVDELRRLMKAKEGRLSLEDVPQVKGRFARELLESALRVRRAVTAIDSLAESAPHGFTLDYVVPQLLSLHERVQAQPVELGPEDLERPRLEAHLTSALVHLGWSGAEQQPRLSDLLRTAQPEMHRWDATSFESSPRDAARAFFESLYLVNAGPGQLERALAHGAGDWTKLWTQVVEPAQDEPAVLDPPHVAQRYVDELHEVGADFIVRAAGLEPRETARLPAMRALGARLAELGLFTPYLFHDLALGVRAHGMPSVDALVDYLQREGGLRQVDTRHKGVSSVPLAIESLRRGAQSVAPGFGDSAQSLTEVSQDVAEDFLRWRANAQAAGRPLLILGEGSESARAFTTLLRRWSEAALDEAALPVGYVEFTQSGLNHLQEQRELLRDAVVQLFANSPLKKLGESDELGRSIVRNEVAALAAEGLSPAERDAVVVGYGGSVGPGVAAALRDQGFRSVTVVDTDAARLAHAQRAGFERTVLRLPGESLPEGNHYFSCVGREAVMGPADLARMPHGARVVNCASRGELDEPFLLRARRGEAPGVQAAVDHEDWLPEHRTLRLRFGDHEVHVRSMGQPDFDGVDDRSPFLADLYMCGLLASLVIAAQRLLHPEGLPAHGFPKPLRQELELEPGSAFLDLPPSLQAEIAALLAREYPVEMAGWAGPEASPPGAERA